MIVAVDLVSGGVELHERNAFDSFAVVASGAGDVDQVAAALGNGARPAEDDHVWVGAASVEALADPPSAEWSESFRAMLRAVERFGWYDAGLDQVKAHVEWL